MTTNKFDKASHDELNSLHAIVAKELIKRMKSGEATASELSVAIKFLKDNGVEQAALPGSPIASLVDSLPFASSSIDGYAQ
jgi:hypothetical protein